MDSAVLITAFFTLFVIIDPIGLAPIFASLTQGMSAQERRKIALHACGIAFAILSVFAFFGETVLGVIGISMPAFRIAGGCLLFLTALDMLFERRTKRRENQAEGAEAEHEDDEDPSVFPLAIPLIAGPGSIATVILLAGQTPGLHNTVLILAIALVVLALNFGAFLLAGPFEKAVGKTGITVTTRLFGMILAALAVQFILDGLRDFGFVSG